MFEPDVFFMLMVMGVVVVLVAVKGLKWEFRRQRVIVGPESPAVEGAEESVFYLWLNDKKEGPFTKAQVAQMLRKNQISFETPFALAGALDDWQPIEGILGQLHEVDLAPAPANQLSSDEAITPIGIIGVLCVLAGIICTGYFAWAFEVTAPGTETLNFGALNERQNGVVIGMGLVLFGGLMLVVNQLDLLQRHLPKRLRAILKNLDQER